MSLVAFPDWKKIGKKLRDILRPPVDAGPSREERRAQRLRDGLKGFVYLDDFDELEAWSPECVDNIQQANTPLLKRSGSIVHDQDGPTTSLLLCHDYSGGYHDYESVRPSLVQNKMYSCNYLQFVETFVYFSHKLVCVPPPTWTNTMHRNGVKILGTFIVESEKIHSERMLVQKDGEFIVAKRLAAIANAYGFDGWLLNVEIDFPKVVDDGPEKLAAFIRNLKRLLGPEGLVIWYDALTSDNKVDYQNGLTEKNAPFALAADSLFTNYKWTKAKLEQAKIISQWHGILPKEVLFGIDVWAQCTDMPGPPRVTFPAKGGGGTNTGLGLATLAENGFSAAIFGPGWTHEHFSTSFAGSQSIAESVGLAMWEGSPLPDELSCDCRKGKPHHTQEYRQYPIIKYAREFPAGSSSFFHTDFRGAFELSAEAITPALQPRLGSQAILPHLWPTVKHSKRYMYAVLPDRASQGLLIKVKMPGAQYRKRNLPAKETMRLCLYKLSMPADGSLEATFDFSAMRKRGQAAIGFYTAYKPPGDSTLEYQDSIIYYPYPGKMERKNIDITSEANCAGIVEIGVFCTGHNGMIKHDSLVRIFNITIKPKFQAHVSWCIEDIRLLEHEHTEGIQKRLAWRWKWKGSNESRTHGMPWSEISGPFSHFTIMLGGRELSEAHCTEVVLQSSDFGMCEAEGDVEVVIKGVLFGGGGEVSSLPFMIPKSELWIDDDEAIMKQYATQSASS